MKIISVVGTRPNFMKIAPLMRAIHESPIAVHHLLVHTGQHYDYEMSKVFFEDLELSEPDIYLGVGSGTHAEQTGKIMIEFEKVLLQEKPDLVIVVGDVNSTLAAALVAVKLYTPIAHVEAGLRSYDRTMPEEINRLLTDAISDYLFTTSKYDDDNLKKEGISSDKIFCVGNVMADSLLFNLERARRRNILSQLKLEAKGYAVLTLHRPSHVDNKENLLRLLTAIEEIAQRIPIVFPVHPRTQKRVKEFNLLEHSPITTNQFLLIEPLGYLDFLCLMMNSRFVITDSGGVQAETTILNVPCLTLKDIPEWTITLTQGSNVLVGDGGQGLAAEAGKILAGEGKRATRPELWDGKTAERIVGILCRQNDRVYI